MCTALCIPRLVFAPPSVCMILPPPFPPNPLRPPLPPPYPLYPLLPPPTPPYLPPLPPLPPPPTPALHLQGRGGGDFVRYMPVTSITHCAGTYHIPCAHSYRLPHSHITALGHIDTAHENKYRSYGHVVAYPQPFPCTTCCIVRQFCFAFDEIPLKNAKKKPPIYRCTRYIFYLAIIHSMVKHYSLA